MENQETFHYIYSAKEQDEVRAIRQKYTPREKAEDPLTQLRRLDASVTEKATAVSLVFGIIGALIMGTGMSLAMTDIGNAIGLRSGPAMLVGIFISIVGIALECVAYPLYNRIVKAQQKKIAPEILRLSDELLK